MGTMATLRTRLSDGSTREELLAEGFLASSVSRAVKQVAGVGAGKGRDTGASTRTASATQTARPAPPWAADSLYELREDLERKRLENSISQENARALKLSEGQPATPARTQLSGQDALWGIVADTLREKLQPARQAPQSPFSGVREMIDMVIAFRALEPPAAPQEPLGLTGEMQLALTLARIESEERLAIHQQESNAQTAEGQAELFKLVGSWAGNLAAGLGKMTYAPEPQAQLAEDGEEN